MSGAVGMRRQWRFRVPGRFRASSGRICRWLLILGCAVGLIASSAPSGANADTSGFGVSPPGQPLLQWLPEEINAGPLKTFTQDQAVAAATRYDVIVAYPGAFSSSLGAMRAANPDLVVLAYMNGTFVPSTQ